MKQKSRLLVLACPLAMAACATVPDAKSVLVARSILTDTSGVTIGSAEVRRTEAGLMLDAKVSGLSPGPHGIHLHMTGKCEAPGFTSAGGHLNPNEHQHGTMNPAGPHLGDLPNINVGPNGTGSVTTSIPGALSDVFTAINDADGTAVVVHAGPDDYRSDPSGNSGARIACGVLSITTD